MFALKKKIDRIALVLNSQKPQEKKQIPGDDDDVDEAEARLPSSQGPPDMVPRLSIYLLSTYRSVYLSIDLYQMYVFIGM